MTTQEVLESWNESVIPKDELEKEAHEIVKNALETIVKITALKKQLRHCKSHLQEFEISNQLQKIYDSIGN